MSPRAVRAQEDKSLRFGRAAAGRAWGTESHQGSEQTVTKTAPGQKPSRPTCPQLAHELGAAGAAPPRPSVTGPALGPLRFVFAADSSGCAHISLSGLLFSVLRTLPKCLPRESLPPLRTVSSTPRRSVPGSFSAVFMSITCLFL